MMLYLAEGGQDYEEDHQGPVQGGSLQHQAGPNAQAAQNCTLIYLGCYREPLLQQREARIMKKTTKDQYKEAASSIKLDPMHKQRRIVH